MNNISPFASVSPAAALGKEVTVGPFAVIEPGVVVGDGCHIETGAILKSGTELGARVKVHSCAVLGGPPQSTSFDPAVKTKLRVGDGTVVRESVTISLSTDPDRPTTIGLNCLLMANAHVGHDCLLGDNVILANGALIAGHVTLGDHAFISGNVAIHQHCVVGEQVMCSGLSAITANIPPFCVAAERNGVAGINLVGLRRRGLARETIAEIRAAYRAVYLVPGMNLRDNARAALETGGFRSAEARSFLEFFFKVKRPTFVRPRRGKIASDVAE